MPQFYEALFSIIKNSVTNKLPGTRKKIVNYPTNFSFVTNTFTLQMLKSINKKRTLNKQQNSHFTYA
jgi:hypothetical protein